MIQDIKKDQVFSVKIYFINPINLLSVITDTLIRLEFETYSVDSKDRLKLVSVLDKNIRNVLFICVLNEQEIAFWLDYIDKLFRIKNTFIQTGVFVYNSIELVKKLLFLERGIPVIPFSEIRMKTLDVMKKILFYFEAKGKRKYIKTRTTGKVEVFFDIKDTHKQIKGKVIEISAYAFSCRIHLMYIHFFSIGEVFHNIVLVLQGSRVRTSVKLIGVSKKNPEIYVFKYKRGDIVNEKMVNNTGLSNQDKEKVHKYIRLCLKINLKKHFDEVVDNVPRPLYHKVF